jgi:GDPmannose 4,6-dehydratase
VFGYNIVRHYRFAHKLFAVNGILFNHESPRRGSNFVTNKVAKSAVRIKLGLQDKLALGNIDSYRDWGHSKDYVRAMHLIMNHTEPDDFVVATGVTNSVGDMCNYVFSKLGLDYKDYVTQDPLFMRAEELKYLRGDATKLRNTFGWEPEYTFETLMDEMIEHWLKVYG